MMTCENSVQWGRGGGQHGAVGKFQLAVQPCRPTHNKRMSNWVLPGLGRFLCQRLSRFWNTKGRRLPRSIVPATVLDAAKLMNERRIGALVVTTGDRVVGIFTERDMLNRIVAAGKSPEDYRCRRRDDGTHGVRPPGYKTGRVSQRHDLQADSPPARGGGWQALRHDLVRRYSGERSRGAAGDDPIPPRISARHSLEDQ